MITLTKNKVLNKKNLRKYQLGDSAPLSKEALLNNSPQPPSFFKKAMINFKTSKPT